MLSEPQKKAADLAGELQKMGTVVINPMPLAPGASLRFRVLESKSEAVIGMLKDWGWEPRFLSSGSQFCINGTTPLSHLFEIEFPVERSAVPGDRITGKLSDGKRGMSEEVKVMRKHLGLK